jgi:carboxypeptidase C (cathepsin A)
MKVLVLNGRCDLVCPVDTMHYAIDHMALDPKYRANVSYEQFDAGHMMYINLPDLQKLQKVVENFILNR